MRDVLVDQTLKGARQASASAETIQDFEAARNVAYSGIGTLEGLYSLRNTNPDGLFLLTKAWCGVGQGFIMDDYEAALEREDEIQWKYHQLRARAAFDRAKFFGLRRLKQQADGFDEAARKQTTLRAWLRANIDDPEMAEPLYWLGLSWVSRVSVDTENAATISELWVGLELLEHVIFLDETVEHGMAHVVLGGFAARSVLGELAEAKKHFDRALELSGGKYLPVQLALAIRYHCTRKDQKSYTAVLRAILDAKDPAPNTRLANVIAQRRARRYLGNRIWQEECGFEGG